MCDGASGARVVPAVDPDRRGPALAQAGETRAPSSPALGRRRNEPAVLSGRSGRGEPTISSDARAWPGTCAGFRRPSCRRRRRRATSCCRTAPTRSPRPPSHRRQRAALVDVDGAAVQQRARDAPLERLAHLLLAAHPEAPRGVDRQQRRHVAALLEARVVGDAEVQRPRIGEAVLRAHGDVPGVLEREAGGERGRDSACCRCRPRPAPNFDHCCQPTLPSTVQRSSIREATLAITCCGILVAHAHACIEQAARGEQRGERRPEPGELRRRVEVEVDLRSPGEPEARARRRARRARRHCRRSPRSCRRARGGRRRSEGSTLLIATFWSKMPYTALSPAPIDSLSFTR